MPFSEYLKGLTENAKERAAQAEEFVTKPNPPVWAVIGAAVVVIVLIRVVVVAF